MVPCTKALYGQRPEAGAVQVSLASDFIWNWNTRETTASFGYDYMLRQCRLRGRIDTDGKVRLQIYAFVVSLSGTTRMRDGSYLWVSVLAGCRLP